MPDNMEKIARPEIFKLKPYIPGKPVEEVQREMGLTDIIKMASNENPLGSSPLAEAAVRESLGMLHVYPDANCYYLRQKMAAKLGLDGKSIIIGNGSDEILRLIAETFIHPGDEVIFAHPTFIEYEFTAQVMGATCVEVPLKNHRHDLPAMLDAVNERTRIIYICNPNNPTGTIVTRNEMSLFLDSLPDKVFVVMDEAYGEYNESADYPNSLEYLQDGRNIIILRTFSKIYGLAALRVGYAITDPELAGLIERVREPFNVNLLAQNAAAAALDDLQHVADSRANNNAGKAYLCRELGEMGLKWVPSEANFLLVDTGRNCRLVFESLLKLGIIVRSGDAYGYPTHIRVTVGLPEHNERFIRALKSVLEG